MTAPYPRNPKRRRNAAADLNSWIRRLGTTAPTRLDLTAAAKTHGYYYSHHPKTTVQGLRVRKTIVPKNCASDC